MPLRNRVKAWLEKASQRDAPTNKSQPTEPSLQPNREQSSELSPDGLESTDLWQRAEQKLKEDKSKAKIYQAYVEILESQYSLELKAGAANYDAQVSELLNARIQELEEKNLKIPLGPDRSIGVRDLFTSVSKKVLLIKGLVNDAASFSPPAALACGGAMAVLSVLSRTTEQRSLLLPGLDRVSGTMARLFALQDLQLFRAVTPYLRQASVLSLKDRFESSLIESYVLILEFYSRALCYLHKDRVTKFFSDIFREKGWDTLMKDVEDSESRCTKFQKLIDSSRLQTIEQSLVKEKVGRDVLRKDDTPMTCLRKLHNCPYQDRKNRNRTRVPGTCEWFTNHVMMKTWNESPKSSLLLASADPGCGKSVLARHLVDNVLNPTSTEARTVCYFFFKDDFADQKSASSAICALLHQLLKKKPDLMQSTLASELEQDHERLVQSFPRLWDAFENLVTQPEAGEVICVLDALDECQNEDQRQLIHALCNLFQPDEASSRNTIKFLVTSRPYEYILRGFRRLKKDAPIIRLSGEDEIEIEKIVREIDLVIQDRVDEIGTELNLELEETSFLLTQLLSVPHRTYLWVTLTLDVIQNMSGFTKGSVKKSIDKLPRSVDEAYERILSRSRDFGMTKKLLQIVVGASRPLSLTEISLVLTIEENHKTYAEVEQEPEDRFRLTIRDLCGLFVTIVDSRIYLLHQTAREFLICDEQMSCTHNDKSSSFQWKYSLHPAKCNRTLTEICILSLELAAPTFVDYASDNWALHFRNSDISSTEPIVKLAWTLCTEGTKAYETWFETTDFVNDDYFPNNGEPLSVACYLQIEALVELLLATGVEVDATGAWDRTALWYAAYVGHGRVVELLLSRGAEVDVVDGLGMSPLHIATENENEEVVQILISNSAEVNFQEHTLGSTPLMSAVARGNREIAMLLLANGAKVDVEDTSGRTAIYSATVYQPVADEALGNKKEDLIELLLAQGANINHKDNGGHTAFSSAIMVGDVTKAKLLLEAGAEISSHIGGRTLLSLVVEEFYVDTVVKVDFLLRNGVDINERDDVDGRSPLISAAVGFLEQMVRFLIEQGAKVDLTDENGRTALSWAAGEANDRHVQLLLELGATADLADENGRTALSWGAGASVESWLPLGNEEEVVRFLIEYGATVDLADKNGRTALSWAAQAGKKETVSLLLHNGAKPDLEDRHGLSPLWWGGGLCSVINASSSKFISTTSERDVNADEVSGAGFDKNSGHGHEEQNDGDGLDEIKDKNSAEFTEDRWANLDAPSFPEAGQMLVVKTLLEKGARVDVTDKKGRSPL